ncbi:MAG: tetratricopeptide repeat protein, partial [Vulcanimicrobiota bacterium]
MKPRDIIILAVIALLGCFLASCNNDKQVNQLVTQANQLQSEGKYDKSLETLNRALKLNPSGKVETRILLERSMIYVDLNQFENALNDLKKILDSSVQDKTKATALLTRGYIFYQQQKYAEALEEFERVKKLVEEPSMLAYLYQLEGST